PAGAAPGRGAELGAVLSHHRGGTVLVARLPPRRGDRLAHLLRALANALFGSRPARDRVGLELPVVLREHSQQALRLAVVGGRIRPAAAGVEQALVDARHLVWYAEAEDRIDAHRLPVQFT